MPKPPQTPAAAATSGQGSAPAGAAAKGDSGGGGGGGDTTPKTAVIRLVSPDGKGKGKAKAVPDTARRWLLSDNEAASDVDFMRVRCSAIIIAYLGSYQVQV